MFAHQGVPGSRRVGPGPRWPPARRHNASHRSASRWPRPEQTDICGTSLARVELAALPVIQDGPRSEILQTLELHLGNGDRSLPHPLRMKRPCTNRDGPTDADSGRVASPFPTLLSRQWFGSTPSEGNVASVQAVSLEIFNGQYFESGRSSAQSVTIASWSASRPVPSTANS